MADKLIKHRDVTGVLLQFSQEQVESLTEAMPPEQRQFSSMLANAIKQPHEVWKAWVADEARKDQWHNVRSYVRFLDLSQTDADVPFGVAIVRFAYCSRWELANIGLVLGTQDSAMARVDSTVRRGSLEYSSQRH